MHELISTTGVATVRAPEPIDVIIEFNADFSSGARGTREALIEAYRSSRVVRLVVNTIVALANLTVMKPEDSETYSPIHKLWRGRLVQTLVYESVRTIKGGAARAAFACAGLGVVWAVVDTGVDQTHPHFQTHVAGIIAGASYKAGYLSAMSGLAPVPSITVNLTVRMGDNQTDTIAEVDRTVVSGIAPLCKILSLKLLESGQAGAVSNLLAAVGYIQQSFDRNAPVRLKCTGLAVGV